jgi:hypothetical protein
MLRMNTKIKRFMVLTFVFLVAAIGVAPVPAKALDCTKSNLTTQEAIQCGTNGAGGSTQNAQQAGKNVDSTVTSVINILSTIVGVVAVIMIILGGFRYITSGGSSERVTSAKNTLLYAIIGLVVVALAQVITNFVLNQAVNPCVNGKTSSGQKCAP